MLEQLEKIAEILAASPSTVALTGAGISVDSGIPAFRGSQGLWGKYDPMEYASIDAFQRDPVRVWAMLNELDELVLTARPNRAHRALTQLEALGALDIVVTQNIDGLHQEAGSRAVVEFHGSSRRLVCLDCGQVLGRNEMSMDTLPPRCACGASSSRTWCFSASPYPSGPSWRPWPRPRAARPCWWWAPARWWPRPATCPSWPNPPGPRS